MHKLSCPFRPVPGCGLAGGWRSSRWWSRGWTSSCWGDLGGPWPDWGPEVASGTKTDAGDEGRLGTAADPDSPHGPGACPQQHASSTGPNSHIGEPESGAGGERSLFDYSQVYWPLRVLHMPHSLTKKATMQGADVLIKRNRGQKSNRPKC